MHVDIFFDFAQTFGTVSTPILLKKLESLGIKGNTLRWFGTYLSRDGNVSRLETVFVRNESSYSEYLKVEYFRRYSSLVLNICYCPLIHSYLCIM